MYNRTLSKYWLLFEYEIKQTTSYRMDAVMTIVTTLLYPLALVIMWTAVYTFGGYDSISGFSLNGLIAYLFILSAINTLVWSSEIAWMIQWDVKTGDIAMFLTRPVSYIKGMVVDSLSETLFYFTVAGIPLIAIVILVTGMHVTLYTILLFAIAISLTFLIGALMSTILGALSAFITDISGIISTYSWAVALVGGGVFPLSMFPSSVQGILLALPFQFLFYVPDGIITGNISLAMAWGTLALGIAWAGILTVIAVLLWGSAKKRLDAVGV